MDEEGSGLSVVSKNVDNGFLFGHYTDVHSEEAAQIIEGNDLRLLRCRIRADCERPADP